MTSIRSVALAALLCTTLAAQEGNGFGNAFLETTPGLIGQTLTIRLGSPGLAGAPAFFTAAPSLGPTTLPGIPFDLWVNLFDPALVNLLGTLDANGEWEMVFPVANDPSLAGSAPWYAYAAIIDGSLPAASVGLSLSKTVRVEFKLPDSSSQVGDLAEARAFHTAAPMGSGPRDNDTSVLVAGGATGSVLDPAATNTTEIYRPLFAAFQPGPTMATQRAAHQMVKLPTGHLLICGGLDVNDLATDTCELFDPATETLFPVASMHHPRAGHAASLLPNGKVLVTGGLTTWQNADANLVANLATTQATAEVFDPATGTWTLVQSMATPRMGHAHTLLPSGLVLISGGITHGVGTGLVPGQIFIPIQFYQTRPVMTELCEVYNYGSATFNASLAMLTPRAFHSATWVPAISGILVMGGATSNASDGSTNAIFTCEALTSSGWSFVGPLGQQSAFHTATLDRHGRVLVMGGLTGNLLFGDASTLCGYHDGVQFHGSSALSASLSTAYFPTGAHTATRLHDGTFLLCGGGASSTLTRAIVYVPTDY